MSPALAILFLMVVYPFLSLLYISTLRFSALRPAQRLDPSACTNYTRLLSDPGIWERFIFTGKFVLPTVCVQFVLGIASPTRSSAISGAETLIFTIAMLPMMLCPIIVGFLWRYMFNSEWGVVNYL